MSLNLISIQFEHTLSYVIASSAHYVTGFQHIHVMMFRIKPHLWVTSLQKFCNKCLDTVLFWNVHLCDTPCPYTVHSCSVPRKRKGLVLILRYFKKKGFPHGHRFSKGGWRWELISRWRQQWCSVTRPAKQSWFSFECRPTALTLWQAQSEWGYVASTGKMSLKKKLNLLDFYTQ